MQKLENEIRLTRYDETMDPLSIAAAAVQFASLAGNILSALSRFVEQTRTIGDSIRELHEEIGHLKDALHAVDEAFERRPQRLSFEHRHHDTIYRILQSCRVSLNKLNQALPELKDNTTPIQKLKLSLQKSLAGERVKELVHRITSYRGVLQLSLSTLSLGELWINRQSLDEIHNEVKKIHKAIREAEVFSFQPEPRMEDTSEVPVLRIQEPPTDEEGLESSLEREIREWRETVDEVSAAVSLYTPDSESIDSRLALSMHSHPSSSTLQTYEDGIHVSEYSVTDELSRMYFRLTLERNQKNVQQLRQNRIYTQATKYQRRGIYIRTLLSEGDDSGGISPKLADMKETLAEILFESDDPKTDNEVEEILKELLISAKESSTTDDTDRQWRLHHKFGCLYAKQGRLTDSRHHLWTAWMGRLRASPPNKDLVVESAKMLRKNLQSVQIFDEAQAIQDLLDQKFPAQSDPVDDDLSRLYMWSEQLGFKIHSPQFGFDVCDPEKGKAPIHQAIQDGNLEMVQGMVQTVAHANTPDSTGQRPLHLAASARNERICNSLLEKGAEVDVQDRQQQTPLHKCQCGSGGIAVAKLILDRSPPRFIDRQDCWGKTALYMACEKGNNEMASFLLSRGANPDIGGPNQSTPLIRAIDIAQSGVKIHLVKELLLRGADTKLRDGSGRTAFDAAKDAGLASGEIKRLLTQSSSRRPNDADTVNTTNTSSTHTSSAYSYLTYNGIDVQNPNQNPRPGGKSLFNWFLYRSGE